VIKSLALEVEGRPDITIDLTAPGSVEALKSKPFTIKEGAHFRMKANFVVQHDVLSGLKYLQVTKRKGFTVAKAQEMIVSFPVLYASLTEKRDFLLTSIWGRDLSHPIPRKSPYTRRSVRIRNVDLSIKI